MQITDSNFHVKRLFMVSFIKQGNILAEDVNILMVIPFYIIIVFRT